jgi:hypothetical protein
MVDWSIKIKIALLNLLDTVLGIQEQSIEANWANARTQLARVPQTRMS